MKLTIELVPSTSWFSNLRSLLSSEEWDKIRRGCYKNANYKCEICSGVGPKHPVECHETWEYDEKQGIQKLIGLIALCPSCHEVKHVGLEEETLAVLAILEELKLLKLEQVKTLGLIL